MDLNEQDETDDCNLSCLVAVGRVKTGSLQNIIKDYESIDVRPVKYLSLNEKLQTNGSILML